MHDQEQLARLEAEDGQHTAARAALRDAERRLKRALQIVPNDPDLASELEQVTGKLGELEDSA